MTARRDVPRAGVVDEQRKKDALDGATERARVLWDEQAAWFDWAMRFRDWLLLGDGRRWACSQVRGAVLEIAVGTGRNLSSYPAGASHRNRAQPQDARASACPKDSSSNISRVPGSASSSASWHASRPEQPGVAGGGFVPRLGHSGRKANRSPTMVGT